MQKTMSKIRIGATKIWENVIHLIKWLYVNIQITLKIQPEENKQPD